MLRPRISSTQLLWLTILNLLAGLLLVIGLLAPAMTLTPRMGEFTKAAIMFGAIDRPHTWSILQGIAELWSGGNPGVATILFCCSVVIPVLKVLFAARDLYDARQGEALGAPYLVSAWVGRLSMADVFVVALIVVMSQEFPGGTSVSFEWGLAPFATAALLSVVLSLRLRGLEVLRLACSLGGQSSP